MMTAFRNRIPWQQLHLYWYRVNIVTYEIFIMYQPLLVHYLYAVLVCTTLIYMNMRKPVKSESMEKREKMKQLCYDFSFLRFFFFFLSFLAQVAQNHSTSSGGCSIIPTHGLQNNKHLRVYQTAVDNIFPTGIDLNTRIFLILLFWWPRTS